MLISVGKMFVTASKSVALAVGSANGFTLPSKWDLCSALDIGLAEEPKSATGLHMGGI